MISQDSARLFIKIHGKMGSWAVQVHYKGYKAHHDNWVPVEELKPLEDAEKEGLLDQVRGIILHESISKSIY